MSFRGSYCNAFPGRRYRSDNRPGANHLSDDDPIGVYLPDVYWNRFFDSIDGLTVDMIFEYIAEFTTRQPGFAEPNLPPTRDEKNLNAQLARYFKRHFSYAIPSQEAIQIICEFASGKKILEIGAGHGFWAKILEMSGVNIVATDNFQNFYADSDRCFLQVQNLDAIEAVRQNRDCDVLMIIDPPTFDENYMFTHMARNSLQEFTGSSVILVAERRRHSSLDYFFWKQLRDKKIWKKISCTSLPNFFTKRNLVLYCYRRVKSDEIIESYESESDVCE